MHPPSPPGEGVGVRRLWALVSGGEGPLTALLQDVLQELGLEPAAKGADQAHLVLVHVTGPPGLAQLARTCRRMEGRSAILAILPYADDGMLERAVAAGAGGVYALGTPLALFRELVASSLGAQGAPR